MSPHFNAMASQLQKLTQRYDLTQIFNDFLSLSLCTYHRTNIRSRLQDQDAHNEAIYLQTAKPYQKDELFTFAQSLAEAQLCIYEEPYSDPFGEFYMRYIAQGHNGQFFTPEPVCQIMSKMTGDELVMAKNVLDPACGSGRMLLAFAKEHPYNYFYGADNSQTCAKMAALGFFFNGLKGEVAWINSLSMEWYGGWSINEDGLGIIPIEKEQSLIWTRPQPKQTEAAGTTPLPSEENIHPVLGSQLELF